MGIQNSEILEDSVGFNRVSRFWFWGDAVITCKFMKVWILEGAVLKYCSCRYGYWKVHCLSTAHVGMDSGRCSA